MSSFKLKMFKPCLFLYLLHCAVKYTGPRGSCARKCHISDNGLKPLGVQSSSARITGTFWGQRRGALGHVSQILAASFRHVPRFEPFISLQWPLNGPSIPPEAFSKTKPHKPTDTAPKPWSLSHPSLFQPGSERRRHCAGVLPAPRGPARHMN